MLFYAGLLVVLCLLAEWRAARARALARQAERSADLSDLLEDELE
jgi:hypothetical protein